MNIFSSAKWSKQFPNIRVTALSVSLAFACGSSSLHAFTQSGLGIDAIGNAVPMGHEWITRIAVFEVIGNDPLQPKLNDPNDPRKRWTKGLAKNPNLNPAALTLVQKLRSTPAPGDDERYRATYKFVYSAIMGERWVDIGGYNVINSKEPFAKYNCWDAAAQEPVELQQDHFMRQYNDVGGKGGYDAAIRAQKRFAEHFVAAATATEQDMTVWDGGGFAQRTRVNSNYFLFGRAAHLFQDSFSSEHTVRTQSPDNFERVRQVKSYLCATGSEQHSHSTTDVLNYSSGDVIWKPGTQLDPTWVGYKASHMKDVALVATEANRDLWAAFLRTMAAPPEQRRELATLEAQTLINNWLAIDQTEAVSWYNNEANRIENYVLMPDQTGKGQSQSDCMKKIGEPSGSQAKKVAELEAAQRACIYNVQATPGYADLNDPFLRMPYNWEWKNSTTWQTPPANWQLPDLNPDAGKQVTIQTAQSSRTPLVASGGLVSGSLLKVTQGPALPLVLVEGVNDARYFRARDNSSLMISYILSNGAVQLYDAWVDVSREASAFWLSDRSTCNATQWAIENARWKNFMWVDNNSTQAYITGAGNPGNANAQWLITGLTGTPATPAITPHCGTVLKAK